MTTTTTHTPALTPLEALRELYEALDRSEYDFEQDWAHTPNGINGTVYPAFRTAERTIKTYSWHAATIRQSRIVAGLSQVQLAKALGCNVATVEAWERGHRLPSDEHRNKLTHLFTDQENEG
jgi:DNA-binding transcriptional regulator YiaG